MDATQGRMPGDAEADGAAAAMRDLYGRPAVEHAVGDRLRYRPATGLPWKVGRVTAVLDGETTLVAMQPEGEPGVRRDVIELREGGSDATVSRL
jgi:hypothetical protein